MRIFQSCRTWSWFALWFGIPETERKGWETEEDTWEELPVVLKYPCVISQAVYGLVEWNICPYGTTLDPTRQQTWLQREIERGFLKLKRKHLEIISLSPINERIFLVWGYALSFDHGPTRRREVVHNIPAYFCISHSKRDPDARSASCPTGNG